MIEWNEHQGLDGEVTICQVRTAQNPLGEFWYVQFTDIDGKSHPVYEGPSQEEAEKSYQATIEKIGKYPS